MDTHIPRVLTAGSGASPPHHAVLSAAGHPPWVIPKILFLFWLAACLLASQLHPWAFVWLAGSGLAALIAYPFLRSSRSSPDAGEALYFFLLYYALAMLFRGIGLLTFVESQYVDILGDQRSPYYVTLVGWVFFYSGVGLVPLYVGYRSKWASRLARRLARWPSGPTSFWRDDRVVPVALVLLGLGAVGATLRVRTFGGFAAITANLVGAGTDEALGRYWQIALTELAVVGALTLVLRVFMLPTGHRLLKSLAIVGVVGLPLYLITSSKFLLLRLFLPPLLFNHFLRRRIPLRVLVLIFVVFGALFPFLYAYRALGLWGLDDLGLYLAAVDSPWLAVFNRAYDADSFMLILHRTGSELPFQWGRSLLDLGTFFIPRALWPAKPMSFGLVFPEQYMPDVLWGGLTYVTPSLTGELYLNWHVAGIVAGFLLFGAALRVAYDIARTGAPTALLLYAYWFLFAIHLVEGSIAAQIEALLAGIIPILLAHLWLARRQPGAGRTASS